MTDTHEAVRLAEKCESLASIEDAWSPDTYREAAALLRRIPELEFDHQTFQDKYDALHIKACVWRDQVAGLEARADSFELVYLEAMKSLKATVDERDNLRAELEKVRWQPIETAPQDMTECVVVRWVDSDGQEHQDFDYTEDGCWMCWHDHADHVKVIGGHGVSYTPPYQHYMPMPAAPTPPHADQKGQ